MKTIYLPKYFYKSVFVLVLNKYFYKNKKKSKLCIGDRVAVLNDMFYEYGGSIFNNRVVYIKIFYFSYLNILITNYDNELKTT
jgi:hypothetical protein